MNRVDKEELNRERTRCPLILNTNRNSSWRKSKHRERLLYRARVNRVGWRKLNQSGFGRCRATSRVNSTRANSKQRVLFGQTRSCEACNTWVGGGKGVWKELDRGLGERTVSNLLNRYLHSYNMVIIRNVAVSMQHCP